MFIAVERDDRRGFVLMRFPADWQWEDLTAAAREVNALLDGASRAVPVLVDFSTIQQFLEPVHWNLDTAILPSHPHWTGEVIVIGASRYLQILIGAMQRIYSARLRGHRFTFVPTFAAALSLITEQQAAAR